MRREPCALGRGADHARGRGDRRDAPRGAAASRVPARNRRRRLRGVSAERDGKKVIAGQTVFCEMGSAAFGVLRRFRRTACVGIECARRVCSDGRTHRFRRFPSSRMVSRAPVEKMCAGIGCVKSVFRRTRGKEHAPLPVVAAVSEDGACMSNESEYASVECARRKRVPVDGRAAKKNECDEKNTGNLRGAASGVRRGRGGVYGDFGGRRACAGRG